MSKRQKVADAPFRHPNWLESILSLISSINHDTTKSSSTFDRHGVSDIGLVSSWLVGCWILGIGVIFDSY